MTFLDILILVLIFKNSTKLIVKEGFLCTEIFSTNWNIVNISVNRLFKFQSDGYVSIQKINLRF